MRSIGSFDWIRVSMAIKYGLLLRLSVGSIGFFDRFDSYRSVRLDFSIDSIAWPGSVRFMSHTNLLFHF